MTELREHFLKEIERERERQEKKFPNRHHSLTMWLAILMEEVGELAEAILHYTSGEGDREYISEEATQVSAVALALNEQLAQDEQPVQGSQSSVYWPHPGA